MFHFSPSATEQPSMINGDSSDLGTASACRKGTREGQWRRQQRTSTSGQWQRKRRAATSVKRPASLSAMPVSTGAPGDGREPATARAGGKASAGAWRRCRSEARSVEQPPPTEQDERTGGAGGAWGDAVWLPGWGGMMKLAPYGMSHGGSGTSILYIRLFSSCCALVLPFGNGAYQRSLLLGLSSHAH